MRETSKEVEVGGERYRLHKMPVEASTRIHNMLMAIAFKARDGSAGDSAPEPDEATAEERADAMVATLWMLASAEMEEKTYARVQHQCMLACSRLGGDGSLAPVKILDGRWAFEELKHDGPTVDRLVVEVLQFNIAAFFLARLSRLAAATAPVGTPRNP